MKLFVFAIAGLLAVGCATALQSSQSSAAAPTNGTYDANNKPAKPKLNFTADHWKSKMSPEAFHILWEQGTEEAGTGKYADNHKEGTYYCIGCGQKLFTSDTKFESGTGWPSFYTSVKGAVLFRHDTSFGMERSEVICGNCGGHLGHVFDDGPKPTGLRYCMNSAALNFKPKS